MKKSEFWLSQLLLMSSTVLGVYLAAAQGLGVAVDFDQLTRLVDQYNIQRAVCDEVSENIVATEEYVAEFSGRQVYWRNVGSISTFVWDSLHENPRALEIPAYLLKDIRRFYNDVGGFFDDLQRLTRPVHGKYDVVFPKKFNKMVVQMRVALNAAKARLLPNLGKSMAALRELIEAEGGTVNGLAELGHEAGEEAGCVLPAS